MIASYKGHADVIKLLLENGADINDRTNDDLKRTALGIAKKSKQKAVVKMLEKAGAKE